MKKTFIIFVCLLITALVFSGNSVLPAQEPRSESFLLTNEEISTYSTVAETFKSGRQPNDTYFFYNQNDMVRMDMTAAWNIRTDASGVIDSSVVNYISAS